MNASIKVVLCCSLVFLMISGCYHTTSDHLRNNPTVIKESKKINGVSLEGSRSPMGDNLYNEISDIHGNWVSLMPYAYSEADDPEIIFKNLKWQWWGEGKEGIISCIKMAHKSNINVMLKPHLWAGRNQFTGDIKMSSEVDWKLFEGSYYEYIMTYAKIADSLNVEMFCIGTEMETFVLERPSFWNKLIDDVKSFYSGEITYAANWNEYPKVPFWDQMDYIGVDAYFPLSKDKNPEIDSLVHSWGKWKEEMLTVKNKYNKPILFTEYGYQSVEYCTVTPWSASQGGGVNNIEQQNAYTALYRACWGEDWIVGGFLWKWHVPEHNPKKKESRFTPQYKPAIDVVREWYGKSMN